jgi:predicted AlkP superfamily phosphohydrolase/phosphomutase
VRISRFWQELFRPPLACAVGLLLTLSCRREATEPPRAAAAAQRPSVESQDVADRKPLPSGHSRVILIGLDAADWSLLDKLAAEGKMPNLARLVSRGRTVRSKSFLPILSPIIWTTIATGATPEVHGVLDFQEVEPGSGLIVPVSGRSRRVPAVWNTSSARGLSAGVVGWWATHPAEQVKGFFVSDRATSILFPVSVAGMTYPEPLEPRARAVIEEEGAVSDTDLTPYLDMSAGEIAAKRAEGGDLANPVVAMAKILGATRAAQRLARDLYDQQRPDFMAVYFEGTDTVGHVFGSYVPPKLDCVSAEDFRRYSRAVSVYYGTIDQILGQWMRRASDDGATLLIASDHGFKWEEGRSCGNSSLKWTTAAFWHRLEGVLAVWGARVKPLPTRSDASVYDIAPTVSALLGLPVDPQMKGRALIELFEGVAPPKPEALFASVGVRRLEPKPASSGERDAYAEKLRSLGYLSGSESKTLPASEGPWPGRTEGGWNNLGIFQRDTGELAAAEHSFQEALKLKPGYASPMFNLAILERNRGRWTQAVDWLFRSIAAGREEPEQTIVQWSDLAIQAKQRSVAVKILTEGASRFPASETIALALSRLHFEDKDCAGAAAAVAPFTSTSKKETLNMLGLSAMCLGRSGEARGFFQRSLAVDPGQEPIRRAVTLLH